MQKMSINEQITVVIPVRDLDKYLNEAIISVLNQESVECNIVVVDAGSTEKIKISSPFNNDSRVRLIRSETPLTAGGARNLGLEHCNTKYLAFLDADDVWPLDRSSVMIKKFINTNIKVVVGMVQNFGSETSKNVLIVDETRKRALLAGGILMKTEVLREIGFFDPTLQSGEFIDWFQRIKSANIECSYIDHLVLERRIHDESTTAGQIHDRPDYLKVVRAWMNQKN
jgi:glycosyltransferase involved in cell wall biosynthesis